MVITRLLPVVDVKLAAVLLDILLTWKDHHEPLEELGLAGISDALDHQCLLLEILRLQERTSHKPPG